MTFLTCIKQLFHAKYEKKTCFKFDIGNLGSELQSCYAFYTLPICIKKYHTEFEIDWTVNMPKLKK